MYVCMHHHQASKHTHTHDRTQPSYHHLGFRSSYLPHLNEPQTDTLKPGIRHKQAKATVSILYPTSFLSSLDISLSFHAHNHPVYQTSWRFTSSPRGMGWGSGMDGIVSFPSRYLPPELPTYLPLPPRQDRHGQSITLSKSCPKSYHKTSVPQINLMPVTFSSCLKRSRDDICPGLSTDGG